MKTRVQYKNVHVREFCAVIADLPLAALCIHGRSFERPYEGGPDLECIKEAKSLVPFIVTTSGSAHSPEQAKDALEYTGADGIALARGTFGRPWIGKQIKEYLETGAYTTPTIQEVLQCMQEHAELAVAHHPNFGLRNIRKVLPWYIKGIPHAADFRSQLVRVETLDDVAQVVASIQKAQ